MSFIFKGNQRDILKKYIDIWKRVKSFIGKDFNAEILYGDRYIKTEANFDKNKIGSDFHDDGVPPACVTPRITFSILLIENWYSLILILKINITRSKP